MERDEYESLIEASQEYLRRVNQFCRIEYQIYEWDRQTLDPLRGRLIFSAEGIPRVEARIQWAGRYIDKLKKWRWCWAEQGAYEKNVRDLVRTVKNYGTVHEIPQLTQGEWSGSLDQAWEMAALSSKLLGSKGCFKILEPGASLFVLFSDISWCRESRRQMLVSV